MPPKRRSGGGGAPAKRARGEEPGAAAQPSPAAALAAALRVRAAQPLSESALAALEEVLRLDAANLAAALHLAADRRALATTQAHLTEVERLLRAALAGERERPAAERAATTPRLRSALALLLLQEGRDSEAVPLLRALGCTHRLAPALLSYAPAPPPSPLPAPGAADAPLVAAWDGALAPALLAHLRDAFGAGSPYWREHGYNVETSGYISYLHELAPLQARGAPARSALEAVILAVRALVAERFNGGVAEARWAEWWAHCRPHCSGHQMHFDSDDEGRGGVRNPIVSTVVCVEACGGAGAPTLVTTQRLGDAAVARRGWLVHPAAGRVVAFDGGVLHGVLPGRGPAPAADARRITFMVAFWRDIQPRAAPDGAPGAARLFATQLAAAAGGGDAAPRWPAHVAGERRKIWGAAPTPAAVAPVPVAPIWEEVGGGGGGGGGAMPRYDQCFQGF